MMTARVLIDSQVYNPGRLYSSIENMRPNTKLLRCYKSVQPKRSLGVIRYPGCDDHLLALPLTARPIRRVGRALTHPRQKFGKLKHGRTLPHTSIYAVTYIQNHISK
jgi:hypothetical protein